MLSKKFLSPNFDERPSNILINTIVIHHTNMDSLDAALSRLTDPASCVSCHYLIGVDGAVFQLVEDKYRAWHAGVSHWRGRDKINDVSIGIELDNKGADRFPDAQINSLIELCTELVARHPIEKRNVVAHYDIAPLRKDDPNHFFPWQKLADANIGLFPRGEYHKTDTPYELTPVNIGRLQQQLRKYGYGVECTGELDIQTNHTLVAFKRHFCTDSYLTCAGVWTQKSDWTLKQLMEMLDEKS